MAIVKVQCDNYTWLNLKNPRKEEVSHLANEYKIHHLHLEDALNVKTQTPRVDSHLDYVHFVFHFPVFDKDDGKIYTAELDAFLKDDFLLTISTEKIPFLNRLTKRLKKDKRYTMTVKRSAGVLLYKIVDTGVDWMFDELDRLGGQLNKIDEEIFKVLFRKQAQTIREISLLRRNLVIFQTAIKPQINMVKKMEVGENKGITDEMSHYWSSIVDHLQRLDDRAADYRELTEGLSHNLESLLTYKINEIMKVLTIFSVIMLPLTLLSGIYGMNLSYLPLARHPLAIFLIGLFMLSLVGTMLLWFKKKNWI